jgi:hypothetical protein
VEGGGGGLTVSGVSRNRGSFVKCVAIQKRLGIPALYDQFFNVLYCDTNRVFILHTFSLYVQASLFDSSEKREGSEVDLTKSKLQQTGEAWRCAC